MGRGGALVQRTGRLSGCAPVKTGRLASLTSLLRACSARQEAQACCPSMRLCCAPRTALVSTSLLPARPGDHVARCPTRSPAVRADGVVRGHRSGLLTTADYNNLCQCETLDDIKLNLVRPAPRAERTPAAAGRLSPVLSRRRLTAACARPRRRARTMGHTWRTSPRLCTRPPSWTAAQRSWSTTGIRCAPTCAPCLRPRRPAGLPHRCRVPTPTRAQAAVSGCQAAEPLGEFMDYCTYGHMIDNVVLIVTGTLHERDVHVRTRASPGLHAAQLTAARTQQPCLQTGGRARLRACVAVNVRLSLIRWEAGRQQCVGASARPDVCKAGRKFCQSGTLPLTVPRPPPPRAGAAGEVQPAGHV